ncbi:hypothetical protein [Lysobacter capsici]|uniref:hypothetical protein n=1 Tax=Lysobacter capsici TaxID=435897 RepID=UPI0012903AB0|nr:hypothetical protein [Lysobacter capsici]
MSNQEFQFFLKEDIDELILTAALSDILGFSVASVPYYSSNTAGVAQITTFDVGFKCGCLVTYTDKDKIDGQIVALALAKKLHIELIFEMEKTDKWLHVQPNGEHREVTVIDIDVGVDIAPE